MKKYSTRSRFVLGALLLCAAAASQAQEMARVISAVPVVQAVAVPQQTCAQTPMLVSQPNSGAGAVVGAIAGGAIGNAVGHGAGQAAATALGVMGGAIMGDNLEARPATVQDVTTCTSQTTQQTRIDHYNVTYEYAGKQYSVQMPNDPGPQLQIQVMPAGVAAMPPVTPTPMVVAPSPVYVTAPPYYAYPYAYPYGPPPVSVHFGFGYYRGFGRRW